MKLAKTREEWKELDSVLLTEPSERKWARGLTNASCTAPQKHVAVASSSLDQPSPAHPASGMYGLDLSAEAAIAVGIAVGVVINCVFSTWFLVL